MSKISTIAKLTAVDGKTSELEAAIRGVIAAADEEPGLEVYSAHAVGAEPGVFYFFELYHDGEARAVHGGGEGMRAAMRAFRGLLAHPPEVVDMTPIAAKGLEI
jgi:quinol monooxygenase YgiN